jgi:DNA-binding HxlR family transcriptional regulator
VSEAGISQDVQQFITEHIRSVVVLEILLLMHAGPTRKWTVAELSRELRISPQWTAREFTDLARRGLIRRCEENTVCYTYGATGTIDQTISALANAYAHRRVSVISMIFAKPNDAIQSFADAFRLRKDQQDG